MNVVSRLLRHFWLDAGDARRALGDAALHRLERIVQDSETRHSGEICLCVEAGLPANLLWRHVRSRVPIAALVRERAIALFGELRVWDTELNNGVLIYLQLVEHRIEIVADRGVARHFDDEHWRTVLGDVAGEFREGRHEAGLVHVIEAVGRTLEQCFPAEAPAADGATTPGNELPDRPVLR